MNQYFDLTTGILQRYIDRTASAFSRGRSACLLDRLKHLWERTNEQTNIWLAVAMLATLGGNAVHAQINGIKANLRVFNDFSTTT